LVVVGCFWIVAPIMLAWWRVPAETSVVVVLPGVAGTPLFDDDDRRRRCRGPPIPPGSAVMALRRTLLGPATRFVPVW